MRCFPLLLVGLVLSGTAFAGEWKELEPRSSSIALDLDWYWVTPERGRFYEGWTDDYSVHTDFAFWTTESESLDIVVNRLASGNYWGRSTDPVAGLTTWLEYFAELKLEQAKPLDCIADTCLSFIDGGLHCAGFDITKGSIGKRFYGDPRSRIVRGWFCGIDDYVSQNLDALLGAIKIRDTEAGAADQNGFVKQLKNGWGGTRHQQ